MAWVSPRLFDEQRRGSVPQHNQSYNSLSFEIEKPARFLLFAAAVYVISTAEAALKLDADQTSNIRWVHVAVVNVLEISEVAGVHTA